jgi:hypothetical protein
MSIPVIRPELFLVAFTSVIVAMNIKKEKQITVKVKVTL